MSRRVIEPNEFDWEDQNRPNITWPATIVYETPEGASPSSIRGIPKDMGGTFEGTGHKASVDDIKSLGITSVELMPSVISPTTSICSTRAP
jgi:glycogen operon protein